MPFVIDTSELPLVIMHGHGQTSEAEVGDYLKQQEALIKDGVQHVLIWNIAADSKMSPADRNKIADWLKKHRDELKQCRHGFAFVSKSTIARGYFTAVFWLSEVDFPKKVFSSLEDAKVWGLKLMEKAARSNGSHRSAS